MHAFKRVLSAIAVLTSALAISPASAALFDVFAYANSSSGGGGVATVSLAAGQAFSVSVDPNDLWSAGALPRWSNANGLVTALLATGSDESGEAAGTLIGDNIFGTWTQDGFTAAFGTLVGVIGSSHIAIGTSFSGVAPESGVLTLYYWDSNFADNADKITADVKAIPEPGTYLLMIVGLGALMFRRVTRRS